MTGLLHTLAHSIYGDLQFISAGGVKSQLFPVEQTCRINYPPGTLSSWSGIAGQSQMDSMVLVSFFCLFAVCPWRLRWRWCFCSFDLMLGSLFLKGAELRSQFYRYSHLRWQKHVSCSNSILQWETACIWCFRRHSAPSTFLHQKKLRL